MLESPPYPAREAVVGVGTGILLTVITCGIYYFFWQYKQMEVLNAWLQRKEFDFATWLLLTIITCGIFAVYYEYKMAKGINDVQEASGQRVNDDLAMLSVLLAVFGFGFASVAIQQMEINKFYGHNPDF